jgi:hypothetical protein
VRLRVTPGTLPHRDQLMRLPATWTGSRPAVAIWASILTATAFDTRYDSFLVPLYIWRIARPPCPHAADKLVPLWSEK